LGLILIMFGAMGSAPWVRRYRFGAIWKKTFAWHTGFWGEKADGWHYGLMFGVMKLVIAATTGGA
jgi:hypothetical protein